jgi:predicted TIM-barrel enzyme
VVVGLQEVLKASFGAIVGNWMKSNATRAQNIDQWKVLICQALNRVNQFR